jgi:hypothetical protein
MKNTITIFFFLCCAALLPAQTLSFKADSLTNAYLKKVPAKQQAVFKTLQKQQQQAATARRLDSAGYDYALLITDVKPGDSTARTWEYYYRMDWIKEHVSMKQQPPVTAILPARYYYNGTKYNTPAGFFNSTLMNITFYDLHELYYTLDSMVMHFSSIKPVQELTYDATLSTVGDTIGGRLKTLAATEEARLKQTYQLVTLVDRITGKVIVSLQTPALKPKVFYRYEEFSYWSW